MKTVSLVLARQLKENSYPQEESTFYWHTNKHGHPEFLKPYKINPEGIVDLETYAAPTAEEIFDYLPDTVALLKYEEDDYKSYMAKLHVEGDWSRYIHITEMQTSLASAAAKMFIFLKKKELT